MKQDSVYKMAASRLDPNRLIKHIFFFFFMFVGISVFGGVSSIVCRSLKVVKNQVRVQHC